MAENPLLNQYSPVPRARSSTAGKDATQAPIYAGLGKYPRSQGNILQCIAKDHIENLHLSYLK